MAFITRSTPINRGSTLSSFTIFWPRPIGRKVFRAVIKRAIKHSMAFGLYRDGRQVGFARAVTDHATFADLAYVFVVTAERGRGLGTWLVETILAHPDMRGLRRWLLGTRAAQALYRRCGFTAPPPPFSFLERNDPTVYRTGVIR
jgi:GNAT superfamily N-acetyltransferase